MFLRRGLAAIVLALTSASQLLAQDTRVEALARQRAEKAAQLEPYQPGKIERGLLWVEENDPLRMIAPFNGFYLQYGYTGKPVGSGIAFGGGWRHDLFNRHARVVVEAGQSMRGYRMVRTDLSLPWLLDEHLEVGIEGAYRRHPQEDFYGHGFLTNEGDRVSFRLQAPEVQARAMVKPRDWFNAGVRVGRMNVSVGPGTDSRFPSIEERFDIAAAPGLAAETDYIYTDVLATLDTRDQPGNARDGAYIGALWRRYDDMGLGRFDFHSVEVEVQHFLPIYDKKRVFAARFNLVATTADDEHEVPFYFRPTIGGSTSLRSAPDFRYRGRNAAFANFEYRWEAFSGLDMALFSDVGTVAPRLSGLEFSRLRGAYGIGLRFNTYKAVFLRLDVAGGGSDGIHTFLKFSKAF